MAASETASQSIPAIQQGPVLRERVYSTLEDLIVRRVLQPGERLLENELAAALGVSRNPVREALTMLARTGWVDIHPRTGAYVHAPTPDEIDDFFDMRTLLESYAAERAASRVTAEQLDVLEEIWREGVSAVESGDVQGIVSANSAFHDRISEWSGNGMLHSTLSMMKKRVRWYFSSVADVRGMASWNEHRRIIDALRARDAAHASTLMRAHTMATADMYRSRAAAETATA
ncbi:transcriptional regulator [Mycolicibacterium aurum]|uniref:Transcriptional regulator n=1 Tax=Mycolicibacterium aurum TaxID=1791 RepID=A0A448IH82_MYCAU|nr:GntR family transcriptional regulator [Mycolicibacterium aurum]VEG51826.1 transcriptional regulator [Mycolicibacterium aurum]